MLKVFAVTISALGLLMQPAQAARRCVMPDGSAIYIIGTCPSEKKPPVSLPESAAELEARKAGTADGSLQNMLDASANPPSGVQPPPRP